MTKIKPITEIYLQELTGKWSESAFVAAFEKADDLVSILENLTDEVDNTSWADNEVRTDLGLFLKGMMHDAEAFKEEVCLLKEKFDDESDEESESWREHCACVAARRNMEAL